MKRKGCKVLLILLMVWMVFGLTIPGTLAKYVTEERFGFQVEVKPFLPPPRSNASPEPSSGTKAPKRTAETVPSGASSNLPTHTPERSHTPESSIAPAEKEIEVSIAPTEKTGETTATEEKEEELASSPEPEEKE